jgi:hypothetical protein
VTDYDYLASLPGWDADAWNELVKNDWVYGSGSRRSFVVWLRHAHDAQHIFVPNPKSIVPERHGHWALCPRGAVSTAPEARHFTSLRALLTWLQIQGDQP